MPAEAPEQPEPPRPRSQRRIDVLEKLRSDVDLWVASADETGAAYAGFALAVAAERGEPWRSFFTPGQLSGLLEANGMTVAEQTRQRDAVPAALWDRSDALRPLDLCRLAGATVLA